MARGASSVDTSRMRSDVIENRQRILEAATAVLAGDPNASMQEIADAAALNRGTLYRHFPKREQLVVAIHAAAVTNMRELYLSLPKSGPVLPSLIELVGPAVEVASRYRVLILAPIADPSRLVAEAQSMEVLAAAVHRAQRAGEVDRRISPIFAATTFGSQVLAAATLIARGGVAPADAIAQTRLALRKALTAAPETND
ncbi:TetR/AcrR family transcriptional regulator [Mycobacterium sp. UM_Kg1]|uniref:TetR/AcrR family transcriptional regulator n=1 Tax=Mycobacterium sp. UM_Kg1 TaxID=1545691 RepID=UPI00061B5A2E|nr:TetR/AcrR family transcriptional regulator [Mycobacterium sp. UM_Kg1]